MSALKLSKGDIVQFPNENKHKIIYVLKGLLRMYLLDEKGKEHIFMFAPEGWTLSDFTAIAQNKMSTFYIDSLEDSEIEITLKRIDEKIPNVLDEYTQQTIHLMGRRIATLQQRVIMLLSFSAFDRYRQFLETYPNIAERVPQKMIASYLGITPQSLSKIRRQNIFNEKKLLT
jgi:CRP-like cAMP-binding protein